MIDIRTGKQLTRREVIGGIGACLAAGCAPFVARTGFGARHGIGLRTAAWAKSGGVPDFEIVTNQENYTNQVQVFQGLTNQFGAGLFIAEQPRARNNMTGAILHSGNCFRYRGGVLSFYEEIKQFVPNEKLFLVRIAEPDYTHSTGGNFLAIAFYNGSLFGGCRYRGMNYAGIDIGLIIDLIVPSSTELYFKTIDINKIFEDS